MDNKTTRRNFLSSAAGAAALGSLGTTPASARIEAAPWGIKLGIASYSFRKFDRAQTIEMAKALETPWISVKEFHLPYTGTPEQLQQARNQFETAGLKIMSGGTVYMLKDDAEDIRRYFEYAKNAGMPMMVCGPTHATVKTIERFVKEYNIKIAIHNHGPEDKNFPTPESVLEAVHGLDPRMGLCMDIGHTVRTGDNVVKAIANAGDRLLDMHIKDLADLSKRDSQCDVGDGNIPIPAIFKQLKKMNYQGCVNLEYEIHADSPMPGMQRSMSYMRGVLAGLASA